MELDTSWRTRKQELANIPDAKKSAFMRPDLYYSAFWRVDYERLSLMGIKYLIIDVDSTIAHVYKEQVDPRAKEWLEKALGSGLIRRACLVSNTVYKAKEARVKAMAELMRIPYVAAGFFNQKPLARPFKQGLELMGATPEETAVIGDQIHTDILGGNRMGMFTVLVMPLGPTHWSAYILMRRLRQNRLLKKLGVKLDDVVEKIEERIEKAAEKKFEEHVERKIKLVSMIEEQDKEASQAPPKKPDKP